MSVYVWVSGAVSTLISGLAAALKFPPAAIATLFVFLSVMMIVMGLGKILDYRAERKRVELIETLLTAPLNSEAWKLMLSAQGINPSLPAPSVAASVVPTVGDSDGKSLWRMLCGLLGKEQPPGT